MSKETEQQVYVTAKDVETAEVYHPTSTPKVFH